MLSRAALLEQLVNLAKARKEYTECIERIEGIKSHVEGYNRFRNTSKAIHDLKTNQQTKSI